MSFFSFLENTANTVGHDVSTVARGDSNPGGGVFGFLRTQLLPNDQQLQGKVQQVKQATPQVIHSVTRTVPEAVTSLIPEQKTYTPGSPIEKAVFGSTPVQNIEAKVASNYNAHPNLNPVIRVGLAGAEGVGSVAQDVPVFKFLGTVGKEGVNVIANIDRSVSKVAPATAKLNVGKLGASTEDVNKPNVPEVPTYYHGGTPIDKASISKSDLGYSVTTNKNVAKWFTNTKGGGKITEHTIAPDAKVLHTKDIPKEIRDSYGALDPNKSVLENLQSGPAQLKEAEKKLVAYARSKGYDAIDMKGEPFVIKGNGVLDNEAELRILNHRIIQDKPVTQPTQGATTLPNNPSDIHVHTPNGVIRIAGDEMKALQDAQTGADVRKVIGNSLPPQIVDKLAVSIPNTKDPHIIGNLIGRAVSPALPRSTEGIAPTPAPTPVATPVESAGQGTPDISQQIISHLNERATPTREAQEVGYSAERSARLARSQVAGANLPGLEGHQAEATALGGALPKQDYNGLAHLAPDQQDALFTQGREMIKNNPDVQNWDKFNTAEALRKVVYGNGGVPQRGEIKLLSKAFGADFGNAVESNIHSNFGEKAFALWRAGLLTGPQTITKIVASHGVQSMLETLKDVPAVAVDKFASLISGNRTLALTLKGKGEGFGKGAKAGKELLATGVDRNPGNNTVEFKNQVQFGKSAPGKVAQAYVDFVGRAHGSLYKPFYGSAHLNSLYSTALAAAKNNGLRGAERDAFVEDLVRNPSKEALAIADHDAQMNSFQQQTALSQAAGALQKVPVIGKVLAPFTRIPAAIATDLINYSPAGIAKTVYESIQAAKSDVGWTLADQRKLAQGLGRSITGSAAIIPGMMLYNKGIMTLGYPSDPKEQQLWAQEGKQPNSILIRGKWRSLGSLGPLGSVLEIGGHTADSLIQGKDIQSAIVDGFAGGAQSIEEQSYLRGVSGAVNALNDPGRYAASFEKQTAGSIIPTLSNTVANATDKFARQSTSPLDAIKSRVPGQRESLPIKLDTFGNPIPNSEVGADRIIDPFQSSTAELSSPLSDELRRLQNAGQGIVPNSVKKVETFNGVKTPLTPQQVRSLTTSIGQATEQSWNQLINDSGYKDLPDDQKKQLLTKLYDQIVTQQKEQFAERIQGGIFSPTYQADKVQSKQGRPYVFQ